MYAQNHIAPEQSIEQVIAHARAYAQKHEVDVSGKYIYKAEHLHNRQYPTKRGYWKVLWANKQMTKGGGVEVRFYADGETEVRYHK